MINNQQPRSIRELPISKIRKHDWLWLIGAGPLKQFVSHLMGDAQHLEKRARHVHALSAQSKTDDPLSAIDDDLGKNDSRPGADEQKEKEIEI